MGMSASQIRYCMLQARKTDIEYQGQQINQQRTTLATQSSAYNTELLTLSVPTPPSTEQYTTTTYSFNYNGNDCTIKGVSYNNGTYTIAYEKDEIKDTGSVGSVYSYSNSNDKNIVTLNGQQYELEEVWNGTSAVTGNTETLKDSSIHESSVNILGRDIEGFNKGQKIYAARVLNGASTYCYFTQADITAAKENSLKQIQSYKVAASNVKTSTKMENVTINWTETGRMSSVTTSDGKVLSLSVNTVADNNAYESAYNEYLYQKDEYNKKMDDINAKLDVVQAQDKKLELQLTNLDTQEQAIKQEMDAVKSVCKTNIEKTFSVFG